MIRVEVRGRLVIAHFPENPTAEEAIEFFDRMSKNLARRQRTALVLNALEVRSAPFAVRDVASRFLKDNRTELRALMVGQATVLSSPLIRGALTAIHFVAPPGYPTKSFADVETAIRWAEGLLASPPGATV